VFQKVDNTDLSLIVNSCLAFRLLSQLGNSLLENSRNDIGQM